MEQQRKPVRIKKNLGVDAVLMKKELPAEVSAWSAEEFRKAQNSRTIDRVLRAFANDLEVEFATSPALAELEAAILKQMARRGITPTV